MPKKFLNKKIISLSPNLALLGAFVSKETKSVPSPNSVSPVNFVVIVVRGRETPEEIKKVTVPATTHVHLDPCTTQPRRNNIKDF